MKVQILIAVSLMGSATVPAPAFGQRHTNACSAESVAHTLVNVFESNYILADGAVAGGREVRRLISERQLDTAGRDRLAEQLTAALARATGDRHIAVEWIDPAGPPAEEADWIAQWRAGAPQANYGIPKIEILPGNIGYLAIRSFHTYEDVGPTLRAAMMMVRHTKGLILDLRDNGGGDSETARAVEGTFLGPDQRSPLRTETRLGIDSVPQSPDLAWERYGSQRPLAILINGRSFSAPEAVSFGLASAGRATVIGSRSAGGAHMTDAATLLPCGFQAWIPNRRPFDPNTGESWERTGVTPHIEAADPSAVPVAHLHLLRQLREKSEDPGQRTLLERLIGELEPHSSAPE